jgi:outer membrane protein insertion porin family
MISAQFTPPYSAFKKNYNVSQDEFTLPEYTKFRLTSEWYIPIGKPMGADKSRQFVLKAAVKMGFMGRYNSELNFSPFERFQLGDAGLTNNFGLLGYDIISQRGYPVYQNSDPRINPEQQNATKFFTMFNKYTLELRYPFVTNPSSTIYGETFFEAANGWYNYQDYNPFRLRRDVGVGLRFFLPMFGLLGFDYAIGLDRIQNGSLSNASRFTFSELIKCGSFCSQRTSSKIVGGRHEGARDRTSLGIKKPLCGVPEASRDGLPTVGKASRLTSSAAASSKQ